MKASCAGFASGCIALALVFFAPRSEAGLGESLKRWMSGDKTTAASASTAHSDWLDDYEKALTQAKAEKKLVLLEFTGSDWCPPCMKLDKEVFSKKGFTDYAKENLVLVEVDFPQSKEQSKKLKAQNEKLQAKFGVESYPTIIVLSPDGKKVGELGYQAGGPGPFTAKLNTFKGK